MHIYEVGQDQLARYARDLVESFESAKTKPGGNLPTVWVTVGQSGHDLGTQLHAALSAWDERPAWVNDLQFVPIERDDQAGRHEFVDPADAATVAGRSVLLIDTVINTGATLLDALALLQRVPVRPLAITLYTVAARIGAKVVPNYFAIPAGPSDRVFLPWQPKRRNNRLASPGIFRILLEDDLTRPNLEVGHNADFITRRTWRDRWYDAHTSQGHSVLLCEIDGAIAAFISFRVDGHELEVDEIATAVGHERKGLAGALLRYAETTARSTRCRELSLWAHERDDLVAWYSDYGYRLTSERIACGADGAFVHMRCRLGSAKSGARTKAPQPHLEPAH